MPNLMFGLFVVAISMGLAGLILLMPWVSRQLRKALGFHVWSYRNPHDRTCEKCGRHQVEHHHIVSERSTWWETFRQGNGNLLICKAKNTKVKAV